MYLQKFKIKKMSNYTIVKYIKQKIIKWNILLIYLYSILNINNSNNNNK